MTVLGVNTFLFSSRFSDKDIPCFETIKSIGFDGVEVTLQEPGDFDPVKVKSALDNLGLQCLSLCGIFGEGRDLRGSEEEQSQSCEFIRRCIDTAEELGAPLVSGPLYSRVGRAGREKPENYAVQALTVARHLRRCCDYAARRAISIGIEPLIRFETDFINTCAEALSLVDAVDRENIGIHLDTFHMNVEEENPAKAILTAGKKLVNIHVSENTRGRPGTGTINWNLIRDALRSAAYSGPVILESFHPDIPDIAYAAGVRKSSELSHVDLARKAFKFLRARLS